MIRLILLLGVGLFAAMLIGGQDRGQLRFGLMATKEVPAVAAAVEVVAAEPSAVEAAVEAAVAQVIAAPAAPPLEDVSYAPAEPVMSAPPVDPAGVVPQPTADAAKILFVAAKSVNVREGPGKDFGIVSRLVRGEAVLVVSAGEGPDGWSLIRIEGDGVEGYVASRLLSE